MTKALFTELDHHVRYLYILLGLVFRRNLKDNILLVVWNWFPRNGFDELAQPGCNDQQCPSVKPVIDTYFIGNLSLFLDGG